MEKLFDAVNTKSYLPPPEQPSSGSLKVEFFQHQEKETKKEEVGFDFSLHMHLFPHLCNLLVYLTSQFLLVTVISNLLQFISIIMFLNIINNYMTTLK